MKARGKERKAPSTGSTSPRATTTKMRGNYDIAGGPCSSTHGLVYIIHSFFAVIGSSVFCSALFLMHAYVIAL
jgi:hypothetical protein